MHSGSVRAADHFIPGATVTARQGTVKLVAYTDEAGQYSLVMTPGTWEISVEMLGFTTQAVRVSGDADSKRDWALEMPRIGDPTSTPVTSAPPPAPSTVTATATPSTNPAAPSQTPATPTTAPAVAAVTPAKPAAQQPSHTRRRTGPASPQGFQNATRKGHFSPGPAGIIRSGSRSQGPAPAAGGGRRNFIGSRQHQRRTRAVEQTTKRAASTLASPEGGDNPSLFGAGFDSSGGPGGMPPGMSNGSGDSLGLGGFGASAIQGGFGARTPVPWPAWTAEARQP